MTNSLYIFHICAFLLISKSGAVQHHKFFDHPTFGIKPRLIERGQLDQVIFTFKNGSSPKNGYTIKYVIKTTNEISESDFKNHKCLNKNFFAILKFSRSKIVNFVQNNLLFSSSSDLC